MVRYLKRLVKDREWLVGNPVAEAVSYMTGVA